MLEKKHSLFELVQEAQRIINQLAESGGELTPELENELANLNISLPHKIDSYAFILDKLEAEEAFWKERSKQLAAVSKGCANVRDRIKESIKKAAINLETDELVGNDTKFKISNAKPKLVFEESLLDSEYKIQVISYEIDKKKIEEDLRAGFPVKGAKFEETKSLRIYFNKGIK